MFDLFDTIYQRRSIRKFKKDLPPIELLQDLIYYATLAPNAMNRQDWHFSIILSEQIQHQIFDAVKQKWEIVCKEPTIVNQAIKAYVGNFSSFISAPVLIAADVRRPPAFLKHLLKEQTEWIMGSAASSYMAVQNLLLVCHAKGLGACIYTGCIAAETDISKILKIPAQRMLTCLVAVGYPDETPNMPKRKKIDDIITIIHNDISDK